MLGQLALRQAKIFLFRNLPRERKKESQRTTSRLARHKNLDKTAHARRMQWHSHKEETRQADGRALFLSFSFFFRFAFREVSFSYFEEVFLSSSLLFFVSVSSDSFSPPRSSLSGELSSVVVSKLFFCFLQRAHLQVSVVNWD